MVEKTVRAGRMLAKCSVAFLKLDNEISYRELLMDIAVLMVDESLF